jgi:hypothetical protein
MSAKSAFWPICNLRPSALRRTSILAAVISLLASTIHGGGVVTNRCEADLNNAVNGGGIVTLGSDGTVAVTSTKIISANTVLDATGYTVTVSGGNSVRIFNMSNGSSLTISNLTIANGYTSVSRRSKKHTRTRTEMKTIN